MQRIFLASAVVLAVVGAFFIGAAWGTEPSARPVPVRLSPLSQTFFGAESDLAGRFEQMKQFGTVYDHARFLAVLGETVSQPIVGSGTVSASDAKPDGATPVSGPTDSCYGGPVPDAIVTRESGGNPDVWNGSGSSAWGCFQILGSTWASSCSDIGVHGQASVAQQKECASRLPSSAWSY